MNLKFSYAYWRAFRITIQQTKLYQSTRINGCTDDTPGYHRAMVAITGNIRDWTVVFSATNWSNVPERTTWKQPSILHCPPVLITNHVCCSKVISCEHYLSIVTLARAWQKRSWLSNNRHRTVAAPCVYMNASRLQGFRVFDVDGRLLLYILIAAGAAGLNEIRWLSPYSRNEL